MMRNARQTLLGSAPTRLKLAALITLLVVVVKVGCIWWATSLARRSDTVRYLLDAVALLLTLQAFGAAPGPAPRLRGVGSSRLAMLLAYANALLLLLLAAYVGYAGYQRLHGAEPRARLPEMLVALSLFALNATIVMGLQPTEHLAMPLCTTLRHMARAALSSLGVLLASVAVLLTHAPTASPLVALFVATLMTWLSWVIVRDNVAM
jgi:cobalt-zinc-cadmium efflux system protein